MGGAITPARDVVPTATGPGGTTVSLPAFAMHATSVDVRSLGAIAGVSIPAWRFDFSAEVFGGFRALGPSFDWASPRAANAAGGGCWTDASGSGGCPSVDSGWTFTPRVEPRLGVALRVQPWVTLRALGGGDVERIGARRGAHAAVRRLSHAASPEP